MSKANTIADVFKHVEMHGGNTALCWEWKGKFNNGDQRPYFTVAGKRAPSYAYALEAFKGPKTHKDDVARHRCDNGTAPIGCCNPHHLEWGTKQDNSNDMVDRERHGIPATVLRAIRKLLDKGRKQQEIADLYGISRETVSSIATGRSHGNKD